MKKLFSVFLVLLFAASVYAVDLEINNVTYSPSPAMPGEYFELWAVVKNNVAADSKPVTFDLVLEYPFSLDPEESSIKEIGVIKSNQSTLVKYKVRVDSEALNGTYSLRLKTIEEGGSAKSTPYDIDVQRISPQIEIISVSPIEIAPGEVVEVKLDIKNIGTSKALDLLVGSIEDRTVTSTGVVVEREIKQLGSSFTYLSDLGSGIQTTAVILLGVNPEADQQTYMVPITIKFKDEQLTEFTQTKYIGIKVVENARLDSIISDYSIKPFPGATTELTFDLFNTGIGDAKSVVIELSTEIGVFENKKQFIGTMNADDFDSFKETLKLNSDIQKGEYPINILLNYKDQYGNDKTLTKTLMLKVYDMAEVSTESFNIWFYVVVLIVLFFVGRFGYRKFIKKKTK